jgi:hypothetical protein
MTATLISFDRQEFEIQRELRAAQNDLVGLATLVFMHPDKLGSESLDPDKDTDEQAISELEESQFRNVFSVALETDCVEVLTNFIRYQIGREQRKWGAGKNGIGARIIKDLEERLGLQGSGPQAGLAARLAERLRERGHPLDKERKKKLWAELSRFYLGYASRRFYYLKKGR